MAALLKSDLFQRFAGGFGIGALVMLLAQPDIVNPVVDALKAAAGIA
ncbi:hypothetical protein [Sphingomonas sp. C3-2]|nr:hypothetical protein [Sphingomonas sp. C3-2]WOK35340.1 hypothetical protein QYC26_09880 [Sphingomonas sp. C3-2]